MASVAGYENAGHAASDLFIRHVVELVAKSLADVIDRPPGHFLHLDRVGPKDPLYGRDQAVDSDVPTGDPFVLVEFVQLDVDANEIASFARDDQNAALVGGLDQTFHADIRKVGDGENIHHAPRLIGRVPAQRAPEGLAHGASRPVATHDIPGLERLDLPLVRRIDPLEPDRHRMGRRGASGGVDRDLQVEKSAGVMRFQPACRIAHDIKVVIMYARLVQDDVRKLREPVFDILYSAMPSDSIFDGIVRLPKCGLVNPACLLHHTFAEAERLEHLHGPAGNAVSLAELERAGFLLNDLGLDVWKSCQLRSQCQPRRSAADDQNVDFVGKVVRLERRLFGRLRDFRNFRIAGSKAVEMELHRGSSQWALPTSNPTKPMPTPPRPQMAPSRNRPSGRFWRTRTFAGAKGIGKPGRLP